MKLTRLAADRLGGGRTGRSGVVLLIIMIIMLMIVVLVMVVIMVRLLSTAGSSSARSRSRRTLAVPVITMGLTADGSCRRRARIDRGGLVVSGGRSGLARALAVPVVAVRLAADALTGRRTGVVLSEGEREEGHGGKGGEG